MTVNAAPVSEIQQLMLRYHADKSYEIKNLSLATDKTINTLIKKIDPWASWRAFNSAQLPQEPLQQAGIGADLLQRNNRWWLIPYRDGSLDQQGIITRVQLLSVNKQSVNRMTSAQLSKRLRGAEGSVVCISIIKKGENQSKQQKICMHRKKISSPTIEEIKAPQATIIRIRTFKTHETRFLLQQSLKRLAQSQDKFYIDLRESPGGDLYEALDCAGLFLPHNTQLVQLLEKNKQPQRIQVPSGLSTFKQPLSIIVGPDTASAAEVFAGVLQYQGRARIVGERTKGKCISQTDFFLSDGSILHLSNMKIYYPNGDSCHIKGVIPDITQSTGSL